MDGDGWMEGDRWMEVDERRWMEEGRDTHWKNSPLRTPHSSSASLGHSRVSAAKPFRCTASPARITFCGKTSLVRRLLLSVLAVFS